MRGIEDALRANPRLEETSLSGSETTTIFMDKKAQTVWKVTRASYADPTSFWYKTALFNATFGQDTGVSVLGYGLNEMGEFSIIGLQRLVDIDKAATNKLTPQRIFTYLKTVFGPNLRKTGDYAFETPLVTIRDAGPGNVVVDKQGRILLPQNLRDFAGLDKNVTVVGCNNHAEFWDSDAWNAVNAIETTPENIAAVMEELDF